MRRCGRRTRARASSVWRWRGAYVAPSRRSPQPAQPVSPFSRSRIAVEEPVCRTRHSLFESLSYVQKRGGGAFLMNTHDPPPPLPPQALGAFFSGARSGAHSACAAAPAAERCGGRPLAASPLCAATRSAAMRPAAAGAPLPQLARGRGCWWRYGAR